jgi:hypothetical protein
LDAKNTPQGVIIASEFTIPACLKAHERTPRVIVLDLDDIYIPLYRIQEGRFCHGYYQEYWARPEGARLQWT